MVEAYNLEAYLWRQRARRMLRDMLLACCHFKLDRRGAIIDYYDRCCCCNPGD